MKLAVNLSMIFTEVSLRERFALAAQHGFQHVEIQFPYELSIEDIQNELTQHQLSLCLINVPAGDLMQGGLGLAGVPGREQEFKRAVQQAIAYATALNVPTVNILAGKQGANSTQAECLKTLVHNLKYACEEFANQQIQPVFEMINGYDMPGFLIQTVDDALLLLQQVQHPALKMQYDCYHMARMQEDVLGQMQQHIEQIGHIQFADSPGRHEPGTGNLAYTEIFAWLQNSTYPGYISAEYRPSGISAQSFAWKTLISQY